MVSEALKRLNAGRRRHARTEAEIIREPGTAAQFRQHWIDLAGVPLILLSADEAMAAWNANTYWAFSESSEMPAVSRFTSAPGWIPRVARPHTASHR